MIGEKSNPALKYINTNHLIIYNLLILIYNLYTIKKDKIILVIKVNTNISYFLQSL